MSRVFLTSTLAGVVLVTVVFGAGVPQAPPQTRPADDITFTAWPGFEVMRAVPAGKTDSYVAMTFDSRGRPFVSKEVDHPRQLIDADGDGVYEAEKIWSDKVRNCQGLWFDGPVLYGHCAPAEDAAPQSGGGNQSSQNRSGLYRMADTNGDDVADTFELLAEYVGGIQEHGPHAIRRGPDGEMTLMIGNNTFVKDESRLDPASPFNIWRESQFLTQMQDGRGFGPSTKEGAHGTVHRFDRGRGRFVVLAGALRNAYDHGFNLAGELFTFDSDMEWDINLPWFREVRTVHMIPGGDNGYRNGSGKFPPYYVDSLPPVRDLGRGSPVGIEFYQHTVYPAEFHDALLEADWSRGRLLWSGLTRKGATYGARDDRAELVHGEPLNITDLEVGPDGLVYFTTGGRMTQGAFYRIRYTGPTRSAAKPTGILAVVRQPQPLSSWGWAAIERAKASMGAAWATDLEQLARDAGASPDDRSQAVYMLQRHGPPPPTALLSALVKDGEPAVRAAAVYVAGVQGAGAKEVAATALKDADALVQRRAAEALVRMGQSPDGATLAPVEDIYALLGSPDRFVRFAGRLLLQRTPRAAWKDRVLAETDVRRGVEGHVAYTFTAGGPKELDPLFERQVAWMKDPGRPVEDQLRILRAFQLAAIEAKGVAPARREQIHAALAGRFPSKDDRLNRELASVLAYCGKPEAITKLLAAIAPEAKEDAQQQQQIHYVYALREITEGWTLAQKEALMDWFGTAVTWRGGASFPGTMNLMFDAALRFFSEEEKKMAYGKVPRFAPLTEEELAKLASSAAGKRAASTTGRRPGNVRAQGVAMLSPQEILEYQIFVPVRQPALPERGRPIYEKACAQCHRFGAVGTDFGPDLTTLRSRFKKKDVLEAILWPSQIISEQYESVLIQKKDGDPVMGLVVREDDQRVVLQSSQLERPVDIPKAQIASREKSKVSMMPEGLINEFDQQEIAHLLAFLLGPPPQ